MKSQITDNNHSPRPQALDSDRAIQSLLSHKALWRASHTSKHQAGYLPSGYRRLDQALPHNGWPTIGTTEFLVKQPGIGEFQLIAPALACLSQRQWKWIVWIAPPHMPYAPALAAIGIQLDRILIIQPSSTAEALWAAEQCIKSHACSAVLLWAEHNTRPQAIKRLQVASKSTQTWNILFREAAVQQLPSPAPLRIALSSTPIATPEHDSRQHQLQVEIFKRPGGWPLSPFNLTLPLGLDCHLQAVTPLSNSSNPQPVSINEATPLPKLAITADSQQPLLTTKSSFRPATTAS